MPFLVQRHGGYPRVVRAGDSPVAAALAWELAVAFTLALLAFIAMGGGLADDWAVMTATRSDAHQATGVYLLRFPRGVGDTVGDLRLPDSLDSSGWRSAMARRFNRQRNDVNGVEHSEKETPWRLELRSTQVALH